MEEIQEEVLCTICKKSYSTVEELSIHSESHNINVSKVETTTSKTVTVICDGEDKDCGYFPGNKTNKSERKQLRICVCHFCGKPYREQLHLMIHEQGHQKGYFQCDMCGENSQNEDEIMGHIYTQHLAREPYTCELCRKKCKQRRNLKAHFFFAHVQRKLCRTCHIFFDTVPENEQHRCSPSNCSTVYSCYACSGECQNHAELVQHLQICTLATKHFLCKQCDVDFDSAHKLNFHKCTHDGVGVSGVSEEKCNTLINGGTPRTYSRKQPVQIEVVSDVPCIIPDKLEYFTCGICYSDFTSSAIFDLHMQGHVQNSQIKKEPGTNKNSGSVLLYVPAATVNGNFSCPICSIDFTSAELFESHIPIHEGTNSSLCLPSAENSGSYNLNRKAMKLADDPQPTDIAHPRLCPTRPVRYPCSVCGVVFHTCKNFRSHTLLHNDFQETVKAVPRTSRTNHQRSKKLLLKPHGNPHYQCKICDVNFTSESFLKSHLSLHT